MKYIGTIFIMFFCLNTLAQDTLTASEYFKSKENCSFFIKNEPPRRIFRTIKKRYRNKEDITFHIILKDDLSIELIYDGEVFQFRELNDAIGEWLSLSNIVFYNKQSFTTCKEFSFQINFHLKDKTVFFANSVDFYDRLIDIFNNSSSDYFIVDGVIVVKDNYYNLDN